VALDDAVEEFHVIELVAHEFAELGNMRGRGFGKEFDRDHAGRQLDQQQVFRIDRAPGGHIGGGRGRFGGRSRGLGKRSGHAGTGSEGEDGEKQGAGHAGSVLRPEGGVNGALIALAGARA
jgi:hypothetical protein